MYVRTYVRMYVCMYVCVYVCMYICMYVYHYVLGEDLGKLRYQATIAFRVPSTFTYKKSRKHVKSIKNNK